MYNTLSAPLFLVKPSKRFDGYFVTFVYIWSIVNGHLFWKGFESIKLFMKHLTRLSKYQLDGGDIFESFVEQMFLGVR